LRLLGVVFLLLGVVSESYAQPQRFTAHEIATGGFVEVKAREWKACHQQSLVRPTRPDPEAASDALQEFVEAKEVLSDLETMEKRGLQKARAKQQPWSGDYWAYSAGILGARTADESFTRLPDWLTRYEFVTQNPAKALLQSQGPEAIMRLSPSEKYDLLTGDERGSFTAAMWAQGKRYFDEYGQVEEWMGICHGWAAAAMMEPRPQKSAEVLAYDLDHSITLTPSEIKGLVSYSWATNPYRSTFVGQRCNKKDPERDQNGRLIDSECFDLNPATWHSAVVSRLGLHGRSFIMDVTYDYEVWNQPVLAYSYQYFNPDTGATVRTVKEARVKREDMTNDRYAKYRSDAAVELVGIVMQVAYIVETAANERAEDSEEFDEIRWSSFTYDLELDKSGKIIGGEWYQPEHPDFIWTPLRGARPMSPLDSRLSVDWDGEGKIPSQWAIAAQVSSAAGLILDSLSKAILRKSR